MHDPQGTPTGRATWQWRGFFVVTAWPGRGRLEGDTGVGCSGGVHKPPGPHASPSSSEPDLITAYTRHSVDVAQHRETDEALAGEEAAMLGF